MKAWIKEHIEGVIMVTLVLLMFAGIGIYELTQPESVQAASPVPPCIHVATADSIKVYYCEDIHLFVNQLGFMAFEP